jgi:LDH2 family malate/lactate/ureidoglycolate dehydrogenase
MAPGDREWAVALDRQANGISLDPVTANSFAELAHKLNLDPLV